MEKFQQKKNQKRTRNGGHTCGPMTELFRYQMMILFFFNWNIQRPYLGRGRLWPFFFLVFHWSVRRPIDTRRDRDHYVDVDLRLRPTSTTTEGVGERSTNVPESRHVSRLVAALVFCFFVFNLGRSDSQSERPEWTHLGGRVYWVNFYFFNTHRLGFI